MTDQFPLHASARARLREIAEQRGISEAKAFGEFLPAAVLLAVDDCHQPQTVKRGGKKAEVIPSQDLTSEEFRAWFIGQLTERISEGILGAKDHRGKYHSEPTDTSQPNTLDRLIETEESRERRGRAAREFAKMLEANPLYTYFRCIADQMGLKKKDIALRLGKSPEALSMFEARLAEKLRSPKKLRPAKKSR